MKTIVYVGKLRSFDLLCRDLKDKLLNMGNMNFRYQKALNRFCVNDCIIIHIQPNTIQYIRGRKINYVMCSDEIMLREIRDRNPDVVNISSVDELVKIFFIRNDL